jgi:uncharacterized membrane protein (Fun14 family)
MTFEVGLEQVVATIGSGVVLGGVAGFAAKKLLKLAAVVVVLEVGLLAALERSGVLNVYWGSLDGFVGSAVGSIESGVLGAVSLVAAIPVTAGLAGGFLAGFKVA